MEVFFYFTDYGRVGTKLLLNYWIHGDKVEIGPNSLSHDYLCPMTIWGLIKRSHCLHDWSKKNKKNNRWRSPLSAGQRLLLFTSLSAEFILLSLLQSDPLSCKMWGFFFKNGWRSLLQGRNPARGARIRALLFLVLFEDVSRERPRHTDTHAHADKQTQNAHTFHASTYSKRLQQMKHIKSFRCVQYPQQMPLFKVAE